MEISSGINNIMKTQGNGDCSTMIKNDHMSAVKEIVKAKTKKDRKNIMSKVRSTNEKANRCR